MSIAMSIFYRHGLITTGWFDHVWSPCFSIFSNHTMIVNIIILGETWWNHQSHSLCWSNIEHQTSIMLVMEIPWKNPYVWIPWKNHEKNDHVCLILPNFIFTYVLPCFTWNESMLGLVPFFSHWFQAFRSWARHSFAWQQQKWPQQGVYHLHLEDTATMVPRALKIIEQ